MQSFIEYFRNLPSDIIMILIWCLIVLVVVLYSNFVRYLKQIHKNNEQIKKNTEYLPIIKNDVEKIHDNIDKLSKNDIELSEKIEQTQKEVMSIREDIKDEANKMLQIFSWFDKFRNRGI